MLKPSLARVALGLFLLTSPALAQSLPCEKYALDNGMTVILHVDHSLPLATINLWYRVGAKNEPVGRSGFAHLFEHLMFMGTARAPGNTFDTLMESAGGSNNATTSLDRTNYFSEGPRELLPTLLWLDADRLEAVGTTMTQEKLDRQRDIVRNEIRQQVENTPYGRAYEEMLRFIFPPGHPYHWNVYGTHADLEAATVNDVRDFFATFYNPANCSLVVAGDFQPEQVKPLIARYFGTLPPGNPPKPQPVPAVTLDHVVRTTMLDKVELPKLLIAYLSPGAYQPGDAEAELTARILGGGHNGRLYKRLVLQDQSCSDVNVWLNGAQLQSLLVVDATAKPDADLKQIERAIDEELTKLRNDGPTQAELNERTASLEHGILEMLQSIQARADRLNEYEFYFGDPNSLQRDLDRYRHATLEGMRTIARDVLKPDGRLILTVLPETADAAASPRDQRPGDPTSQPSADFTVPKPEVFTLASGATVQLFHRPELPLVEARLLARPTTTLTVDAPPQAGRSSLAAQMMGEGTGDLDGSAFAAALQALGGQFESEAHRGGLTTSLSVLDRNFAPAAKLWLDATFRPRMKAEDFARVKSNAIDFLQQQDQEPTTVAYRVGQGLLFGRETPYGMPEYGTVQTVGTVTLADARTAQTELLSDPRNLTIFIAGNVTRQQVIETLDPLLPAAPGTPAPASQPTQTPGFAPANGLRVAIVDRPDAPQTVVRFFAPGITQADPQRVPLSLLNVALGGSFTSRLNANLREDKGYTYGAASGFHTTRTTGWFVASADLKSDVTGPGVREMLAELRRIHTGDLTADELGKARQTFRNDTVNRFATLASETNAASWQEEAGVHIDQLQSDLQAAAEMPLDAVNAAARSHLDLDHGVLVLVGDATLIREQIKDLGLPAPTLLNADGAAE